MPRNTQTHGVGADQTASGVEPGDASSVAPNAGHRAVLDDVYSGGGRRARIAPGDCVVPHRAAARLQESPQYRVAAVVEVDQRHARLNFRATECLSVHPLESHAIGPTGEQIALRFGVEQVERAALADHGIEIKRVLESLPEFQRELVKAHIVRLKIIRTDDGGIAPDIAKANRAAFQHRDVANAKFRGEEV